jgi:hypothetical protein
VIKREPSRKDWDYSYLTLPIICSTYHYYNLLLFTGLPKIPLWTGHQVVVPRFILGAVLEQIQCTSMENIDIVDKNTPTDSNT